MLTQMLSKFAPRRHRVYRLISRLAKDRLEIYRVEGGRIYLNLHESAAMVQRAMGSYEPAKHALIRRHLRSGMTFRYPGRGFRSRHDENASVKNR
jgi:hypothetical protein